MYEINNKFNINDEVWTVYDAPYMVECPFCKGSKEIELTYKNYEVPGVISPTGIKVRCKNCNGEGKVSTPYKLKRTCRFKINIIKASIQKDGTQSIKYKGHCPDPYISCNNRSESMLFKTKEEAEFCALKINMERTGERV